MQLPRILFFGSLAGVVFLYGVAVGAYEIFPYRQLKFALNSVEAVLADRDRLLSDQPTGFVAERRYEGKGVTTFERARSAPGLTLLSGFFDDLPGLRLVRRDGTVLARWPAPYSKLFDDTTHIFPGSDVPATDWNAAVHGMVMLSDGSVVFNFDGKGTVKLDRCGTPVWTLPRMTHHSVDRAAAGGFWIPSRHYEQDTPAYPFFQVPYRDDTILRVADDGRVLSEISLNRILIDNGLFALLVANGRFNVLVLEEDVLHINDIEELGADRAPAFEHFAAGDLLISVRHLNLLLVVDPQDWTVKWHQTGPWLRQHDPDFNADGSISVFDNRSDDTHHGEVFGGSRILSLRPFSAQRTADVVYGGGNGQRFFTNTQGKHQRLDNGNWLIAEYFGGRAFEVTAGGDIVWEYVNEYDPARVARISGAKRYPESYFDVTDWRCDGS